MKIIRPIQRPAQALGLCVALSLQAGGTAFTYQGRLFDGSSPASGLFDVQFALYDAATSGAIVAGPLTNAAVAVTGGLFVASVDFGAGAFTGANRWLEIAVRANGAGAFTTLAPRQAITPAPMALYAATAGSAANYAGALSPAQLSGPIPLALLPAGLLTNNAAGVSLMGTFSGNGVGLTNNWQLGSPLNVWVILDGDSVTESAYNYSSFLRTWPPWDQVGLYTNFAHAGDGITALTNKFFSTVGPFIAAAPPGTTILYCPWIGQNDYVSSANPFAWVAGLSWFFEQVRSSNPSAKVLVVAFTLTARMSYYGLGSSELATRAVMNAGLRAGTNWDWMIDAEDILPNCLDTNAGGTFNTDGTHPSAAGHYKIAQAFDAMLRSPPHTQSPVSGHQAGYSFQWSDPSGAIAFSASAAQSVIPGALQVGGTLTVAPVSPTWVPDGSYPILSWYAVTNSLYTTNVTPFVVSLRNLSFGTPITNTQGATGWMGSSVPARIPGALNGYDSLAHTNGQYLNTVLGSIVPGSEIVILMRLDDRSDQGVHHFWSTPTNSYGHYLAAWEYQNQMAFGVANATGPPGTALIGVPIPTNQWVLWEFTYNGSLSSTRTNGVVAVSGALDATNSFTGLIVGNSYLFGPSLTGCTFEWAEIFVFSGGVLSSAQETYIGNYYYSKYNLAGTNANTSVSISSSGISAGHAAGLTTNLNVLAGGGRTNQLRFSGGILTGVAPQ